MMVRRTFGGEKWSPADLIGGPGGYNDSEVWVPTGPARGTWFDSDDVASFGSVADLGFVAGASGGYVDGTPKWLPRAGTMPAIWSGYGGIGSALQTEGPTLAGGKSVHRGSISNPYGPGWAFYPLPASGAWGLGTIVWVGTIWNNSTYGQLSTSGSYFWMNAANSSPGATYPIWNLQVRAAAVNGPLGYLHPYGSYATTCPIRLNEPNVIAVGKNAYNITVVSVNGGPWVQFTHGYTNVVRLVMFHSLGYNSSYLRGVSMRSLLLINRRLTLAELGKFCDFYKVPRAA